MNNPGEQDLKIHFKDQNMKTSTITSDHVRTTTFPSNTDIKRPLTIYHTVLEPDKIVFIIITAIFLLPISAFLLICCLRRRAKLARERDRQLNFGLQSHAVSLVRFSHFPAKNAVSFRSRSFNRSLELSVVEEKSDVEQTDLMTETPVDWENPTNHFDFLR